MGQGLRRASWSEGGGCGGAAGFSFGERPGSNGGSAGRWLLPFPGNGPGTGGVFLGRRGRAAAGRRASLSRRERVRTDALRGGGCCRSPETARVPAACFFVGGNRLRRGGELLFRGGAGFGRVTHRLRYSPPLFVAITRRLPPPAACHYPPPATSATVACHPCRCLPSRCCRLPPACHYPPPATSAADCVLTACVSTVCRFSPLVITTCRPPLPPAACLLPPSPACHHPLLPAPPPLLTRRTSCQPPRRLCPRRLCPRRLLPPPPLLATPVAVCLPAACRFSPPVITRRLPPATSAAVCVPASACRPAASHQPHPLPAISAAMRRPGGQMGCGGTPRGRSGRDASPARSSAK